MAVPLQQAVRVGSYVVKQHLMGRKRYPLVLMLEPLFRCNLACAGCGKIDYPDEILNQRISVADALYAAEECGAPVVSIAGGEPLLHKELPQIVEGLIKQKRFVYLCTNALLLEKKMHLYKPNPFFTWSVHLDGSKDEHDKSVCQTGVYEKAVEAIKAARPPVSAATSTAPSSTAPIRNVRRSSSTTSWRWAWTASPFPGLFLRARARSAALPESQQDQAAVPRHPRQGQRRQEVGVQSVLAVPRLSGRQPDLSLHPLGQPDAQRVRLAASLLSARRRLREDLQGADG